MNDDNTVEQRLAAAGERWQRDVDPDDAAISLLLTELERHGEPPRDRWTHSHGWATPAIATAAVLAIVIVAALLLRPRSPVPSQPATHQSPHATATAALSPTNTATSRNPTGGAPSTTPGQVAPSVAASTDPLHTPSPSQLAALSLPPVTKAVILTAPPPADATSMSWQLLAISADRATLTVAYEIGDNCSLLHDGFTVQQTGSTVTIGVWSTPPAAASSSSAAASIDPSAHVATACASIMNDGVSTLTLPEPLPQHFTLLHQPVTPPFDDDDIFSW